jgi:hypothetical protein
MKIIIEKRSVKIKMSIIYDIDLIRENANGYHVYSKENNTSEDVIFMCPIFIWKNHPDFEEFMEYLIM